MIIVLVFLGVKGLDMADYQTWGVDHLGVVAGICDQIGLVEQSDAFVPNQHGQRKVSLGEATKAMILNALGFVSRPMYLSFPILNSKFI